MYHTVAHLYHLRRGLPQQAAQPTQPGRPGRVVRPTQGELPASYQFGQSVGKWVGVLGAFVGAYIAMGALKMMKLQNRRMAVSASIVAMAPTSMCCVLGIPFGIWALVVLSKPEVKAVFRSWDMP